jgi:hypothetical protein
LDDEFKKQTSSFEYIDSTDQLYPKLCNEVEAITFVLPEKKTENEHHDE